MRARGVAIALGALALAACATALPPAVKVTDLKTLAGTYSGTLKEVSQFDRAARLVLEPGGRFELTASDPSGFRTLGLMVLEPDGTLTYRYDELRGRGLMFTGKGVVHEGDGQRAIVLTQDDGTTTTTVSKSLP